MPAGSIVVELLAKTGSFETDTARAGRALKKFQKDADETARAVKASFVGNLLAGFAKDAISELAGIPGRLAALVTGAIDAADHLNDLSKKTGIAADTLGGIGFAAKQSGGDLESAAAATGKLNKSLAEAAAGNKQAIEAFDLLKVSVKDAAGNTKNADVVLAELADKFAGYADGPEKAALALRIFGKAGADIIPLLDEGGAALRANIDYFKRYSGVTVETAKAADQFNDTQAKIKLLQEAFGVTLTSQSLPLLQTLADRFLAAKEQGDGFKGTADGIVQILQGLAIAGAYVIDTFQGVGREIGAIAAQAKLLDDAAKAERARDRGVLGFLADPFGSGAASKVSDSAGYTAISDAVKADGERAKKDLARFVADVLNPFQADPSNYSNEGRNRSITKKQAPRLAPTGGAGGAGSDLAAQRLKKELDSQIRLIQDFERAQAAAYQFGDQYLAGVYQDGLTSQADFFDKQKSLREANLTNALDAIDKQIAAEQKYIAALKSTPAPTPEAKEKRDVSILEANEKIKLSIQQRAEAETKASAAEIIAKQQNERATRQLADAYDSLRGATLSALGDDFGAAQIRNAQQVRAARELITQKGGDPKVADDLERALAAQNDFTRATKESTAVSTRLQIAEERIALAVKTGALSENEALQAQGEARSKVVAQLEAQLAVQQRIADSLPNDTALALNVERTRLELDKLKASLDPLKDKFDDVFKTAGENAIEGFLNSTKGLKDRLKDLFGGFGKEIVGQLNKDTAKELSGQLFGKDGIISGAGGALADIFRPKNTPLGESAGVPDRQSILDLFKPKAQSTDTIEASFQSLQRAGIDPTTAALSRLQQAAEGAATTLGSPGGADGISKPAFGDVPSGEQSIQDLFKQPADQAEALGKTFVDTRTTAQQVGDVMKDVAAAGSLANRSLSLMPAIIQAITTSSAVSSAGGGGGGGLWGSLFSAAASYFTGGTTASPNAAAGFATVAGISGGRADGGPVMPGRTYIVGERGPERLTLGSQGGYVTPNHGTGKTQNNYITVNPPPRMDRRGAEQVASDVTRELSIASRRVS